MDANAANAATATQPAIANVTNVSSSSSTASRDGWPCTPKGSPATPSGRGTIGSASNIEEQQFAHEASYGAVSTGGDAASSREEHWSIVMGSSGGTVEWRAPPSPVRKLLKELFGAQPEEPLTWVHNVIWQLQAEEIAEMLGSSGGQASSSAGAFEGPSTVLQPPVVLANSAPILGSPHLLQERYSEMKMHHSGSTQSVRTQNTEYGANVADDDTTPRSPRNSPRAVGRVIPQQEEHAGRQSEWWSGGLAYNCKNMNLMRKDSRSTQRAPLGRWSENERSSAPVTSTSGLSSRSDSPPHVAGGGDHIDDGSQRSYPRNMTSPSALLAIQLQQDTHSMRLSSRQSQAVPLASPRPSYVPEAAFPMPYHRESNLMRGPSVTMTPHGTDGTMGTMSHQALGSQGLSFGNYRGTHNSMDSGPLVYTVPPSLPERKSIESLYSKNKSMDLSATDSQYSRDSTTSSARKLGPSREDAVLSPSREATLCLSREDELKNLFPRYIDPNETVNRVTSGCSAQSRWISRFTGNSTSELGMELGMPDGRQPKNYRLSSYGRMATQWVAASSVTPNRMIWEMIWLMCVLHELWSVPFELVFMPEADGKDSKPSTLEIICLVCFIIDMGFNFIAGYVEKEYFVVDNKKIVDHYLRTWFLMDVGLLVTDIILLTSGDKYKALKIPKLLRAARLYRTWNNVHFLMRLLGHKLYCRLLVHVGHLNLALLLISHIQAVAWAALQPEEWSPTNKAEALDKYLESLFWAFSAVTFGPQAPVNTQAQWLLGVFIAAERETILAGVIFYLVRCVMIHGFSDLDEDHIQDEILGFLKQRRFDKMSQMEVLANVQEVCKARKLQRCFDALCGQALPLQIRTSVADMLWRPKLCSLGLVKELIHFHSQFATELMLTIHGEFLPSLTVLYQHNEASHIAYYVIEGELEVKYTDDLEQPTDDYIPGMWAGEKAVVNFELRRGETVVCKTLAELMVLSAMEFRRLLTRYELIGIFEDLIKVNLWLGFCGRCGLFGDHFSRDCPSLALLRKNKGFFRSLLTSRDSSMKKAPVNPIGKDLRVFLQDYSLEHLLEPMYAHGIANLTDLTRDKIDELAQDPDVELTAEEEEILKQKISSFRKRHALGATKILANTGSNDNYLVFVSHYKVEAGTEATLMQNDILQLIAEDPGLPGHDLASPVFLDTEDLRDLGLLKEHVKRSHNLLLLLTNGVLKRPWVLLEVVTAIKHDVTVLPVEIQRPDLKFVYPDEDYYKRVLAGEELDESATQLLKEEGVELEELCSALRQVFKRIALPFSPHKTATIRKAELQDILKRCRIKRGRASFATDQTTMMQVSRQATLDASQGGAWASAPSTPSGLNRVVTKQLKAGSHWAGAKKMVTLSRLVSGALKNNKGQSQDAYRGKASNTLAVPESSFSNALSADHAGEMPHRKKSFKKGRVEPLGLRRGYSADDAINEQRGIYPIMSERSAEAQAEAASNPPSRRASQMMPGVGRTLSGVSNFQVAEYDREMRNSMIHLGGISPGLSPTENQDSPFHLPVFAEEGEEAPQEAENSQQVQGESSAAAQSEQNEDRLAMGASTTVATTESARTC